MWLCVLQLAPPDDNDASLWPSRACGSAAGPLRSQDNPTPQRERTPGRGGSFQIRTRCLGQARQRRAALPHTRQQSGGGPVMVAPNRQPSTLPDASPTTQHEHKFHRGTKSARPPPSDLMRASTHACTNSDFERRAGASHGTPFPSTYAPVPRHPGPTAGRPR